MVYVRYWCYVHDIIWYHFLYNQPSRGSSSDFPCSMGRETKGCKGSNLFPVTQLVSSGTRIQIHKASHVMLQRVILKILFCKISFCFMNFNIYGFMQYHSQDCYCCHSQIGHHSPPTRNVALPQPQPLSKSSMAKTADLIGFSHGQPNQWILGCRGGPLAEFWKC